MFDKHTPTKELLWGLFGIFKTLFVKYKRGIILAAWLIGVFLFWNGVYVAIDNRITHKHQAVEILRDATVAVMANRLAGEGTPIEDLDIDVNGARVHPPILSWGIQTNSYWLGEMTRYIVPYMAYENLVAIPNLPEVIIFTPKLADDSFHLMGTAGLSLEVGDVVVLNERMLYQDAWDAERLLSTLVHELVHLQGGVFRTGKSEDLESATTAATVEVLAGMCNHGYDLACSAFWGEISDLARYNLRTNLYKDGLPWVYELYSNLFLRNRMERQLSRKSERYWAAHTAHLNEIIFKYGAKPWVDHVVPGILGERLSTAPRSNVFWAAMFGTKKMPFDDTIELLGPLNYVIRFFQYFRFEYYGG